MVSSVAIVAALTLKLELEDHYFNRMLHEVRIEAQKGQRRGDWPSFSMALDSRLRLIKDKNRGDSKINKRSH